MGGFTLSIAMEKTGLHRRLALAIFDAVGTRPANLVLGFMIATALISMWVSNAATVVMMLPMATSVIALAHGAVQIHVMDAAQQGAPIGRIGQQAQQAVRDEAAAGMGDQVNRA